MSYRPALLALPLAAALTLTGCGAAPTTAPAPPPVTVTTTAPAPPPVTVTARPAAVTPPACITALDLARDLFTWSGEGFAAASDAVTATAARDTTAMRAATDKINAVGAKVKVATPKYQAAEKECRAASAGA